MQLKFCRLKLMKYEKLLKKLYYLGKHGLLDKQDDAIALQTLLKVLILTLTHLSKF